MSKTTNSVSQAKTEGGKIKGSINAISQNVKSQAENVSGGGASSGGASSGGASSGGASGGSLQQQQQQQKGGQPKQTKLWTTRRYKKEYDKSVREFKKTRKRFMSYLKRKIL
jgi:hypothetical protein